MICLSFYKSLVDDCSPRRLQYLGYVLQIVLGAVTLFAQANAADRAMPDAATIDRLAATARWHSLLHYNPGATLRGVGESYVDDPDFFLSPDGDHDAAAELRATWQALVPTNAPARCDYPARYKFLAEALNWHSDDPLAHCTKYRQWRERMPIGRLVLVFPAAYLNSPSSMFGHTLLRLDASKQPESTYLSRAINFGARTGAADNSALYAWRGLAGGYPGRFTVGSYVEKIHEYGFMENRDIWEYPLDLDRASLDWLVRHLWELRGVDFDYYFFDENCSFRLLELIKIVRPSASLLEGQRIAELPVNTVRRLDAAGLIAGRVYRPSKMHRLEHLAKPLNSEERRLAERLTHNIELLKTAAFTTRAPRTRHRVAQVAYQALRVRARKQERTKEAARRSLALLRVVQRTPNPPERPIEPPTPPESGHGTHRLTAAGGVLDGRAYGEFGFRMTYHDPLDPPAGYLAGAGISGFDLRFRGYDDGDISLERLTLIGIRSIAPRHRFFKPISWFVDGGLAQTPVKSDRQLGLYLQGGPGLAWRWHGLSPYAFVMGRVETVATQEPTIASAVGGNIGALWTGANIQWRLDLRELYFAQRFDRRSAALSASVPVSQNNAVQASCRYESGEGEGYGDCQLKFQHYF